VGLHSYPGKESEVVAPKKKQEKTKTANMIRAEIQLRMKELYPAVKECEQLTSVLEALKGK
jgi:hypothetical protein